MSRTTREIVSEMLVHFKEITGTELTADDLHRQEVIDLYPVAGALAAMDVKIEVAEDNFHPGDADEGALENHLDSHELPDRRQPQKSQGRIKITGDNGLQVLVGTAIRRKLDGKIYVSKQDGIIEDGELINSFEASQTGQEYNIDPIGEEFSFVSPIPGIDPACFSETQFLNGRDLETPGEMLQRIQDKIRRTDTGGNLPAYERLAKEASPLVVTAKAIKHARGVSTVNTVITSGTTDIDKAVDNGQPVLRLPSVELIAVAQAYIQSKCPTTDDHLTVAPEEQDFDTSIILALKDESLRTKVVTEIDKIWKKYVYKINPQDRIYPTDLEKLIDSKLGHLIKFRRVTDYTVNHYLDVPQDAILKPNILTVNNP